MDLNEVRAKIGNVKLMVTDIVSEEEVPPELLFPIALIVILVEFI